MPPSFSLSIHSLTPPTLPPQPDLASVPATAYRSSLIARSPAAATSPLLFTLLLPAARPDNPLYPADRLQVVFTFAGTGQIFLPRVITSADLVPVVGTSENAIDGDGSRTGNLYAAQVAAAEVPRVKVNEGESSAAMGSFVCVARRKAAGELGRRTD